MDILKKIVIFLSGAFVYLFVFILGGSFINEKILSQFYYLVFFALFLTGFISNIFINRYLYKVCPIRSIIYSFISWVLLFASAFFILKIGGFN